MTHAHRLPIVIVDDNRDAAESLAMVVDAFGYAAHVAFDGPEGLALLQDIKPRVAILDIGLPSLSGYELARECRRLFGKRIRLIAVTGWGLPKDVDAAMAAGFDNHFTKPANAADLVSLVREYLAEA
jgi:CheY-like chemotaxis protein